MCFFRGAWRPTLLPRLSSSIWIGFFCQCVGVIRDKKNIRALAFIIEKTGEKENTILGGNRTISDQGIRGGIPLGKLEHAGLSLSMPRSHKHWAPTGSLMSSRRGTATRYIYTCLVLFWAPNRLPPFYPLGIQSRISGYHYYHRLGSGRGYFHTWMVIGKE